MAFLDGLQEVTERVRRGSIPSPEELRELKAQNRRNAEEAEREDREVCDSLPTWINTTNSTVCNLRCDFCNQAYGKGVDWRMEEPIYQKLVEELYPAVETVQLSAYGEPMMTPQIGEKLKDMERFGVRLEMVTNATLMKGEALCARLARIMGLLTVSIDGATARTFNAIRVGADFDEVVANVRRYNKYRMELPPERRAPLHFNTIIMGRTIRELPNFLRLAKDLGGEHVTVMHLVLFEEGLRDDMLNKDVVSKRLANDCLLKARSVAQELQLSVNFPPLFRIEGEEETPLHRKEPIRCWFLWQRMYIGPFGHVIPCCLSGIHANGNVAESRRSFAQEWNNDLYREMRRRVHGKDPYGPCKTCYLVNRSPDTGEFDKTHAETQPLAADTPS